VTDQESTSLGSSDGTVQWATLIGRMLEDASRILQLELRLFEARIASGLTAAVDRAVSALAMVFAGATGSICLLIALIMWLHKSLEWWQSFALGGVAALIVALALQVSFRSVLRRNL
jgi:hypothetical protein